MPFSNHLKTSSVLNEDVFYTIFQFLPVEKLQDLLQDLTSTDSYDALRIPAFNALKLIYGLRITLAMTFHERQNHFDEYNMAKDERLFVATSMVQRGLVGSISEALEEVKGLYTWQSMAIGKAYHLGLRRQHITQLEVTDFQNTGTDISGEQAYAIEPLMANYKLDLSSTIEILNKIRLGNIDRLFYLVDKIGLSIETAVVELEGLSDRQGTTIKSFYHLGLRRHHLLELDINSGLLVYDNLSKLLLRGEVAPQKAVEILNKIPASNIEPLLILVKNQGLQMGDAVKELEGLMDWQVYLLTNAYFLGFRRQHIINLERDNFKDKCYKSVYIDFLEQFTTRCHLSFEKSLELISLLSCKQLDCLGYLMMEQELELSDGLHEISGLNDRQCFAIKEGYSLGLRRRHLLSWHPPEQDGAHCQFKYTQAESTAKLMKFFLISPAKAVDVSSNIPKYTLEKVMELAKENHISIDEAYENYLSNQDTDIDFTQLK